MRHLRERLERTAAERARSEPFDDRKNFMSVYARLSREDGALMAEALAEIERLEAALGAEEIARQEAEDALVRRLEVTPALVDQLARASMRACLAYYDGKRKPSKNPLATHRVMVRAVLRELGYKRRVSRSQK